MFGSSYCGDGNKTINEQICNTKRDIAELRSDLIAAERKLKILEHRRHYGGAANAGFANLQEDE